MAASGKAAKSVRPPGCCASAGAWLSAASWGEASGPSAGASVAVLASQELAGPSSTSSSDPAHMLETMQRCLRQMTDEGGGF